MPSLRWRRPPVLLLIGVSLLACVVQVVGALLGWAWTALAQWFAMPPLAAALVVAGGLSRPLGRWWLAGIVLSWAGDTVGGHSFLVLLGCFLLAHLCYLAALWPTRAPSVLRRPRVLPYLALGVVGAAVIAPAAGPLLAGPVVVYAAALTLVAVLASSLGRAGVVGGVLFMVSDLVLGLGTFVVDVPAATQTALVMSTYVPAQALLLVAVLGLIPLGDVDTPAATRSRP